MIILSNTVKALLELIGHNKLDAAQLAADMTNLLDHPDWASKGALDIVSSLLPFAELSIKLHKKFTEYKLAIFIEQIRSHDSYNNLVQDHIRKFQDHPEKLNKEVTKVLLIIEQEKNEVRVKYYGRLYLAYLETKLTEDEFWEMVEITQRMFICDFELIENCYGQNGKVNFDEKKFRVIYRYDRLIQIGLLRSGKYIGNGVALQILDEKEHCDLELSQLGEKYCKAVFCNNK